MSYFPALWKAFQVANETGNPGPLLDLAQELGWALEEAHHALTDGMRASGWREALATRLAAALAKAKGEQP